jgi:hypothetical protein
MLFRCEESPFIHFSHIMTLTIKNSYSPHDRIQNLGRFTAISQKAENPTVPSQLPGDGQAGEFRCDLLTSGTLLLNGTSDEYSCGGISLPPSFTQILIEGSNDSSSVIIADTSAHIVLSNVSIAAGSPVVVLTSALTVTLRVGGD